MGIVLEFPARETAPRDGALPERRGEVVILPVIRIERYDSEPAPYATPVRKGEPGGKRRRRASRT